MTGQRDLFAADDAEPIVTDSTQGRDTPGFTFFLGTHHASWLTRTDVPLFISRRSLENRATLPRARGRWTLDSGGFTELSLHGRWTISPRRYADLVGRAATETGGLAWAAIQDWMCEEPILRRTGRSVADHQRATIESWLELKSIAPELPWAPVLQGWTRGDYLDHLEGWARAGIELAKLPVVGVGTVCRRQHTLRASLLLDELASLGLRLHAFGFKTAEPVHRHTCFLCKREVENDRRLAVCAECDDAHEIRLAWEIDYGEEKTRNARDATSRECFCPGWLWMNEHDDASFNIERCDACALFRDDDEAATTVVTRCNIRDVDWSV